MARSKSFVGSSTFKMALSPSPPERAIQEILQLGLGQVSGSTQPNNSFKADGFAAAQLKR
jgi:hypothetical protein